jgi:hypothetical protein
MQIDHLDHPCCDAVIAGQTFHPSDNDAVYAVFVGKNGPCGVTVEPGKLRPWLRLTPGIQLPADACDGFERFTFECEDDSMVDLVVDRDDGEITLRVDLPGLEPEVVEKTLVPQLAWVDEVALPAVRSYLERLYRTA